MSRASLLAFVLGFWSAFGALWLARRHQKTFLYRLLGLDEEFRQTRDEERQRATQKASRAIRELGVSLAQAMAASSLVQHGQLRRVHVQALQVLNMEVDSVSPLVLMTALHSRLTYMARQSKTFTFWQRRTARLQEELDKLSDAKSF
jgi:hypothetical protein